MQKTTERTNPTQSAPSTRSKITLATALAMILLLFTIAGGKTTLSEDRIKILADVEMDSLIEDISLQIFKVAQLDGSKIRVHIISDPSVNAFVYQTSVFVNTGLIAFAPDTNTIFGVLSHEAGHVARRHIPRMIMHEEEQRKNMGGVAALAAVAILGLSPVAVGILLPSVFAAPVIGFGMYMQSKLRYTRDKESEADQSAVRYLHKMNKSVSGLYETMRFFGSQMSPDQPEFAKYLYTHPLPAERMHAIGMALKEEGRESLKINPPDCELEFRLRRIKAKIMGYLDEGEYDKTHNTTEKHRCFSQQDLQFFEDYQGLHQKWRDRHFGKALEICNKLQSERPDDPFLMETKANLLMSSGNKTEAINLYREFAKLYRRHQSQYQLGIMLTTSESESDLAEGVEIYKQLISERPDDPKYYFGIASIYSKMGDKTNADLFLAEGFVRTNDYKNAIMHASKVAKMKCKENDHKCTYERENAQDIVDICKDHLKKRRDRKEIEKYSFHQRQQKEFFLSVVK